jgi:hypothetical protein
MIKFLQHNALLIAGLVASAVFATLRGVSGTDHSALAWATAALPAVLGIAAHFTTIPWAQLKPLADRAAAVTAQVAPKQSAWVQMIDSTVTHAEVTVEASGGFPIPVAGVEPGVTAPVSTPVRFVPAAV